MKSTRKIKSEGSYTAMTTYDAGVMQASVHRLLQRHCDAILKPYGITKAQWLLIGTVLGAKKRGVRVSDLAVQLDTTLAYLTNTINLLESKDMLVRTVNDNDGRAKFVTVHPKFRNKCIEIENTLRDGLRKLVYSGIDREDFNTYMKVMYQLSTIDSLPHDKTRRQ